MPSPEVLYDSAVQVIPVIVLALAVESQLFTSPHKGKWYEVLPVILGMLLLGTSWLVALAISTRGHPTRSTDLFVGGGMIFGWIVLCNAITLKALRRRVENTRHADRAANAWVALWATVGVMALIGLGAYVGP